MVSAWWLPRLCCNKVGRWDGWDANGAELLPEGGLFLLPAVC